MQKPTPKSSSKKHTLVFIFVGVFVFLVGWFVWMQVIPKPLGEKLEYIGKTTHGCPLICDSPLGEDFYYATDLSPSEVIEQFKGVDMSASKIFQGGSSTYYNFQFIDISLDGGRTFTITYYNKKDAIIDTFHLSQSNKGSVLSFEGKDYELIKESL